MTVWELFLCVPGIKPFQCNDCGQKFTRQHSKNYHMMIHRNESRFICKECGKRFRHPSHYTVKQCSVISHLNCHASCVYRLIFTLSRIQIVLNNIDNSVCLSLTLSFSLQESLNWGSQHWSSLYEYSVAAVFVLKQKIPPIINIFTFSHLVHYMIHKNYFFLSIWVILEVFIWQRKNLAKVGDHRPAPHFLL